MATGSNTLMRIQALAGDRGGVLTLTTSTTYQIRRDVDLDFERQDVFVASAQHRQRAVTGNLRPALDVIEII